MEQTVSFPRVYRFGSFELSVEVAELRKNGVHLKLQDQPFHVLCALLEHPGELVPREQLRQQLWPDGTFVDFEHGLNTAIKKIRDVLSDDADTPRYIETIPRKGYRFIAHVNLDTDQAIPAAPTSSRPRWQSRVPFLIGALVIVIGIVVFVLRGLSYPPYLRISATRQLTFTGDVAPNSTIETDGRRVYYFKWYDGHLYSVPVGGGAESSYATRFVQPMILHISPDGSTLLVKEETRTALGMADRIWLQPTNGGPARPLGDIEADFAAWSPDGKAIAFSQNSGIYLTEDEGATYHRLLDTAGNVLWIRWSPGGQSLRFTVFDPKTVVSSVWEARRDGKRGPVAMKLGRPMNACCGIWTRDGQHFLFQEVHDQRTDYWVATEKRLVYRSAKPYPFSGGGVEILAAAASPLENTLFTVAHQSSGLTFKFDLVRRQLTAVLPELSVEVPDFSPDGKWMAICQVHTGQSTLWRVRSDGSEWLQLTDPKFYVNFARYSMDGKRIAMMGKWPDQPWKIYWVSAEGGALHELNVPITSQADPNWMPGNQSILFGQPPRYFAERETPRAIYVHNLQTNSMSTIPGSEGWFSPRLSPDGRSLLALSIDEHKLGMYDFATSRWRVLLENSQEQIGAPFWSPDGKWAYVNLYGRNGSVWRIRVPDGVAEEVLSLGEMISIPGCFGWSSAPDGSIMISCYRPNSNIYALRYE
jgi:DNA-binding winged helix-turn-helix (wHTH) protein/Tol biopolymer transport system component